MKDDELDMLLSTVEADSQAAPVSDEMLRRYGAGEALNEAQQVQVEAYLASSEAARDRLASLQGHANPDPLHDWAVQALEQEAQRERFRRRRFGPVLGAVGGLVAAAAAVLLVLGLPGPADGPAFPTYGLEGPRGAVRAQRNEDAKAEIFIPDSVLELVVRPEAAIDVDHRFAVYVQTGDRWVRRDGVGEVTSGGSGAHLFEARAQDLFGDDFGERRLAVVVSRQQQLPSELPSGTDRKALGPHAWFERTVAYGPAPPPVP